MLGLTSFMKQNYFEKKIILRFVDIVLSIIVLIIFTVV